MQLRKCIETREKPIFANRLVLAAIYLDKRFNFTLDPDEVTTAKSFIFQIWKKKQIVAGKPNEGEAGFSEQVSNEENVSAVMSPFEAFMNTQARAIAISRSVQSSTNRGKASTLEAEINIFDSLPRLTIDTQIIEFWKGQKHLPEMKEIAVDIISAPVTEVSVERMFSHLNFILNRYRTTLKANILEDILLLRMNKKFRNADDHSDDH